MIDEKKHSNGKVKYGDLNHRVGIEQIKARGVNIDELIEKLIDNVAAEFISTYYYTILRMYLVGREDLKEICEDVRLKNLSHFELIVTRIYELGNDLPHDILDFVNRAGYPKAKLPENPTTIKILEILLESERDAIRSWMEVCDLTFGKDFKTYELASPILQEKMEHEAWFLELLSLERDGEIRPSGHFRGNLS